MSSGIRLELIKGQGGPFEFSAADAVTLGRASDSVIHLNDPHVSRRHASLSCLRDKWTLVDNGSRQGTLINGTLLPAQKPCVLAHGDQLGIFPFVLRVDLGGEPMTLIDSLTETSVNHVRAVEPEELENLAGQRLKVLLGVAAKMQEAQDEKALAQTAVAALLQGTGFGRALLLRGHDGSGYEVLAREIQGRHGDEEARISRTLLRAASAGRPVRLDEAAEMQMAESIVGEGVTAALCVPILLGMNVEGFLYLDSTVGSAPGSDAAAFAQALAQFVGMALGEIRRRDLADRQQQIHRELSSAHAVQRRLMPPEQGSMGPWRWKFHSEPGRVVAGDIVGAGAGPEGFWFFLGDVAGKGMGAGMLMASIQAHLAAELERGSALVDALNATNAYVRRHRDETEFATLMAMRLSDDGRSMQMVDAGHAMGAIVRKGAPAIAIECRGGTPIGIVEDPYESSEIPLQPGDRILLFSDGVCEQQNAEGEELGIKRVLACLQESGDECEDVERVMALLREHAAGVSFADDVSVVSLAHGH
ncbi:MAG: SpoIIE family protein phosphatase [Planctomycetes bacterium]|nr:SpoIIE family protein phosphatase [Planctomycetota bacterium]